MQTIKNQRAAELLLAAVITARSTSFVFSKVCMEQMPPFTLLTIRFWIAFLLLAVIFRKKLCFLSKATLLRGAAMGFALFCVMAAEMKGLETTPSSTTALLENTAIVFVPLFELLVFRRHFEKSVWAGVVLAFGGVLLLTFEGGRFSFSTGVMLCILAAVFYAMTLILTDRLSKQDDPLTLGILQLGFMAFFSTAAAFLTETPALPQTSAAWGGVLYLAVVCSGFGFTLQPLAQSGTTSQRAGMFCALSPAVAAGMGIAFLHEKLTLPGLFGMLFILVSIFLPYIGKAFAHRKK